MKEVTIHWESIMGQAVLSQYDYINLIVERYGTGRDLERFSDKFPRRNLYEMVYFGFKSRSV